MQGPDDRTIPWRHWDEATLDFIQEKGQAVFLFVATSDAAAAPHLNAVLQAMPGNAKLCRLLREHFTPLLVDTDAAMPEYLAWIDAGSAFQLGVLSPVGLTPIATIDPTHRSVDEVVDVTVEVLERLAGIW